MELSLLLKKNYPLHLWMSHLTLRLRSFVNILELSIRVLALILDCWLRNHVNLFKIILWNILKLLECPLSADKLHSCSKKRLKLEDIDHLECQFWLQDTTRPDHISLKLTHLEPTTTGKPLQLAKMQRTPRYSYKSVIRLIWALKMPSTLLF